MTAARVNPVARRHSSTAAINPKTPNAYCSTRRSTTFDSRSAMRRRHHQRSRHQYALSRRSPTPTCAPNRAPRPLSDELVAAYRRSDRGSSSSARSQQRGCAGSIAKRSARGSLVGADAARAIVPRRKPRHRFSQSASARASTPTCGAEPTTFPSENQIGSRRCGRAFARGGHRPLPDSPALGVAGRPRPNRRLLNRPNFDEFCPGQGARRSSSIRRAQRAKTRLIAVRRARRCGRAQRVDACRFYQRCRVMDAGVAVVGSVLNQVPFKKVKKLK